MWYGRRFDSGCVSGLLPHLILPLLAGNLALAVQANAAAVLCCAVLCCAVLCCAVLRCAVLCCAVLCCAVLRCAVLCCAGLTTWWHAGAVPLLIDIAREGSSAVQSAVVALEKLCSHSSGRLLAASSRCSLQHVCCTVRL